MAKTHLAILILLAFHPSVTSAQDPTQDPLQGSASAWAELVRDRAELARRATPVEREILKRLSTAQVESYLGGTAPSSILLESGESLESFLGRWEKGVAFDLSWFSTDGGGGMTSTGGVFELSGTVGQADAGFMAGGAYSLTGGFWAESREGAFFSDGFESGDTSAWSSTSGS